MTRKLNYLLLKNNPSFKKELIKAMKNSRAVINPREEKILRLRFGLDENRPKTLAEIGNSLSLTRERIRQIQARALEKLGLI